MDKQKRVGLWIPEDLYWRFKKACIEISMESERRVSMQAAFAEAIQDWINTHKAEVNHA